MYTPVLIIGSGIAGMSVAYNLQKNNIKYSIITKERNYLKSNSIIAPANIRIFENYQQGIQKYMNQCNGNIKMINSIYSNQKYLFEILESLNVKIKRTPIGIIPENPVGTGGYYILTKFAQYVKNINTNIVLVDIKIKSNHIACLLYNKQSKRFININCGVLVFSTGGFASLFKHNDNSESAKGDSMYILQKETHKLKGISTIMFHPFAANNGKTVLVGDIVSCLDSIHYKDQFGNFKILRMNRETFEAIQNNAYHDNKTFSDILNSFKSKDIYLKFKDENAIKEKLQKYNYSQNLLENGMIHITPTAHYTSGGFEVNENFKVSDRIFANGECTFDGDRGIGRIPGHPFTSSIVSGKIIADRIKETKMQETHERTNFEILDKIVRNDESNYDEALKKLKYFSEEVENLYVKNMQVYEIRDIEQTLNEYINKLEKDLKCVKELQVYYSLKLLNEVIQQK